MTRNSMRAGNPSALEKLLAMGATNLTQMALQGQLGRAHGREAEIARVFEALEAQQSVLLLGPPQVGKTAILHEVVGRIVRQQAPAWAIGKVVVSITTGGVLVGTKYLGEWQTRLGELVAAVKAAGNVYLYVEDIWALRDAGRASDKSDGFSTFLRPYLERRDIVLLGEATPDTYNSNTYGAHALSDDHSLMKCFSLIEVEQPSRDATRGILNAVARDLQRQHKVRVEPGAVERAIELTRRFLSYQAFPGKATRLLAEATEAVAKAAAARDPRHPTADALVTVDAVSATFSRMTDLPERFISDAIPLTQDEIRGYFSERVIGQEEAVATVADVVTLFKAEMNDPGRPLGVLFFVGPTGVGKTELAKTLADYLFGGKDKLIRLDMSEFKSPLSTADLLQQLTEKQRRQAFSVLLLDEIEKASPYAFDLFLQAFDDARLTDAAGKTVHLNNTIVVITSNIGTQHDEPARIGFVESPDRAIERRQRVLRAVEEHFRPEFINRLDKIVVFHPLGLDEMRRIARRELGKALMREGVLRRDILLDFREEVLDVLVGAGFSPTYGARPLQRAIKELVLIPLARRIAAQPALGQQLLELAVVNGAIDAIPIPLNPAAQPEPDEVADAGPHQRLSVTDSATGQTHTMDVRRLQEAVAAQHDRIVATIGGERFQALETRAIQLLEETARPSFWDDPDRAREILSAVYQIERVTDRFLNLRARAERLVDSAGAVRRQTDPATLSRLASTYETLERDLALAELELVAGGEGSLASDAVFIRIAPYAAPRTQDPATWLATLRDMYVAWATRKGHEVAVVSEPDEPPVIHVRGPNISAILRGEHGLHKLQRERTEGGDRRGRAPAIQLAAVEILPVPPPEAYPFQRDALEIAATELRPRTPREKPVQVVDVRDPASAQRAHVRAVEALPLALALLAASIAAPATPPDQIARVYHLAKTQYVRDPRTGARSGRPRDVLAGALDSFLLAYLAREEPGATPTRAPAQPTAGRAENEP